MKVFHKCAIRRKNCENMVLAVLDWTINFVCSGSSVQKTGGTQLKLLVTFPNYGQALLKPMR